LNIQSARLCVDATALLGPWNLPMASPNWNEWSFWLKDPESIRNLAFIFGSIAAILGGTYGVVLATLRSVAAMRQARAATDAQVTELFMSAIGFLADKRKVELRLGAIYALERIAQKSRIDRYRVLEILYAFLRERTREPVVGADSYGSTRFHGDRAN
jgi:hypothetical protein